jgi:hypothetical protein
MFRVLFSTLALSAILSAGALAQPSAQQIVDRAAQAYANMMADVDSYLITMDTFGMQHETYFQRVEGGGPLDYDVQVRVAGQTGWISGDDEPSGTMGLPTQEMLERLRDSARLDGETTIDGRRAYVLVVSDPADVFDPGDLPTEGDFELRSMKLFIASDDYTMLGFDGDGVARQDGRATDITMEMRSSDFRSVGGMRHPFLTTMRIGGLTAGMSPQERRQLEEARRQLEQLPPEQRAMMERMMGDQLQQLQRMAEGEALEMEMRVVDLQVNVPRPN